MVSRNKNLQLKHAYRKDINPIKDNISNLTVDVILECIEIFDERLHRSSHEMNKIYNKFMGSFDDNLAVSDLELLVKNTHLDMLKEIEHILDNIKLNTESYEKLLKDLIKETRKGDVITSQFCRFLNNLTLKAEWQLYKQNITYGLKRQINNILTDNYDMLNDKFTEYMNNVLEYINLRYPSGTSEFSESFADLVRIINEDSPLLASILAEQDLEGEDDDSEIMEIPNLENYREINKLAEDNGYEKIRQQGDHGIFMDENNNLVVIPQGRKVGKGLSKKICKQILISNNKNNNGGKNVQYKNTTKLKGL